MLRSAMRLYLLVAWAVSLAGATEEAAKAAGEAENATKAVPEVMLSETQQANATKALQEMLSETQQADGTKALPKNPMVKQPFNATMMSALKKAAYTAAHTAAVWANRTDLAPDGPCKSALEHFCPDVKEGRGARAHCLRSELRAAVAQGRSRASILKPACSAALRLFWVDAWLLPLNKSASTQQVFAVEPVPGFTSACSNDLKSFCPGKEGQAAFACLRKRYLRGGAPFVFFGKAADKKLSESCKPKLQEAMRHFAEDFSLDLVAAQACRTDLDRFCKHLTVTDASAEPGAKKTCLKKHFKELSPTCKEKLFKIRQQDKEDIRLDPVIFTTCRHELATLCSSINFGQGRKMKCLTEHVLKKSDAMGSECAQKVKEEMRNSASDYRLEYRIKERCAKDIDTYCEFEKDTAHSMNATELFGTNSTEAQSGQVLECLKKKMQASTSEGVLQEDCQKEVKRLVAVQAMDPKADPILKRDCAEDVQAFCPEARGADIHICLRRHLKDLTEPCRECEVLQGALEAQSIVMNAQVKFSCSRAVSEFCKDVGKGDAAILRCLQDHRNDAKFPLACRAAVVKDLGISTLDWRFNFGMKVACKADVQKLCPDAEGGGEVLKCLKQAVKDIQSDACAAEVKRAKRQGAANINLNPEVKSACRKDIEEFCSDVPAGKGQVHNCLIKNRKMLSKECAQASFAIKRAAMEDVEMNPKLFGACESVIGKLCQKVPDKAKLTCLEESLDDSQMTPPCKAAVLTEVRLKHRNFFLNPILSEDCTPDANRLCPKELQQASLKAFASGGAVINCLILKRGNVTNENCQKSLFRKQQQRADRISTDPEVHAACSWDAKIFCSEKLGSGKGIVMECLQSHMKQLSEPCRKTQTAMGIMTSENWKLESDLRRVCPRAVDKFCKGIEGKGVVNCLLDRMQDDEMDAACKSALERTMRKRSQSTKYNAAMDKACKADLRHLQKKYPFDPSCARSKNRTVADMDGNDISCLQHHRKQVNNSYCASHLVFSLGLQSMDLRAKAGMSEACKEDVKKLCPFVMFGKSMANKCLQEKRNRIQDAKCRRMVDSIMKDEGADAKINFLVREHCKMEMKSFCGDIPRSDGTGLMTCLVAKSSTVTFGEKCQFALNVTALKPKVDSKHMLRMGAAHGAHEVINWLESHKDVFASRDGIWLTAGVTLLTIALAGLFYYFLRKLIMKSKGQYTVVVAKEMEA
eukprot:TRINITY_DN40675_c0_g1_i1.p1 TRINITY_DN40675_c0_g1~~TRINITY_DN40675_c0_g1_i1.p1  ORF type:complete len:1208 (+),score=273.36 TRINITY_DN40675_c0_g1_i1:47-3670(+)